MADIRIFIDTSYVYALINTNDQWHSKAVNWRDDAAPSPKSEIMGQSCNIAILFILIQKFTRRGFIIVGFLHGGGVAAADG